MHETPVPRVGGLQFCKLGITALYSANAGAVWLGFAGPNYCFIFVLLAV